MKPCWPLATPCCFRGPGRRSTNTSTIPTCWSWTRRNWFVAKRCPWERARCRRSPCCSSWCSCSQPVRLPSVIAGLVARLRHGSAACAHSRTGLPRRELDHGHSSVGAMIPLSNRHGDQRCREADGRDAGSPVGRRRPVRPARRTVPVVGHAWPVDQQHRGRRSS